MNASARSGFTLVETMVALMAFAVIAAAGAALLNVGVTARERVHDSAGRLAALQRTRSLLASDLGQVAPRRVRDADGRAEPQAMSSGGGQTLLRLTRTGRTNPGEERRSSLQRIEYRLVEGRLERWSFTRLDGARPERPQVLLRGVADARVAFLDEGLEDERWTATPDRPLPRAMRITMTVPGYGVVSQLFLVHP